MTELFNPARLLIARQRRGLTRKALAESIGVAPLTITRLEKQSSLPEEETVNRLSKALQYPHAFFFGPETDAPDEEAVSFRSLSSLRAAQRDAAISAGSLAYIIMDWVDSRFGLPQPDLLDFRHEPNPAAAAHALRQHWGLGEKPVSNVVKLLESKGVRVFTLAENTLSVDAFCCWRGNVPYVFLNTMKTAERSRFDAMHELGHLVLHRHGLKTGREAESEANLFASHFLMPQADFASRVPLVTSLGQLERLKKRWGVSVAALAYRLHSDGHISDWQFRGFQIEIRERYGRGEPEPMEREKSSVWSQVLRTLWKEGTPMSKLAKELNIPEPEIAELLFSVGHASSQAEGFKPTKLELVNEAGGSCLSEAL